jgi:hypothetical protein
MIFGRRLPQPVKFSINNIIARTAKQSIVKQVLDIFSHCLATGGVSETNISGPLISTQEGGMDPMASSIR